MVPTGVVDAALIPWPLVPATLIRPPLIRSPLAPPLATVAAVTALVALAVLCQARLPRVSGRRAETDAQPESANAQRADGPILGSSYSG
jgi:hypothetical protein